jgi:choline dehydrogenase-like flavoprotein
VADDRFYDCCVIGTGAGGGILAHRLAKAGLRIISIEQGEALPDDYFVNRNPPGTRKDFGIRPNTVFPPEPANALFLHELFAGADTRSSSRPAEERFRQFQILALNGLQNLWNGVSLRFAPPDFDGWPIGYDELARHYAAVEERIVVCGTTERISALPDGVFIPPKALRPADELLAKAVRSLKIPDTHVIPNRKAIETRPGKQNRCISTGVCTTGCPVGALYKFSHRLLPEIQSLSNYTLRLKTKVTRLHADKTTGLITLVECVNTETLEQYSISARFVVLSAGAIESPRLLFNSADETYANGLGNSGGALGCYLQDNPSVLLQTSLPQLWGRKAADDIGYGDHLLLMSRALLDDGSSVSFTGQAIHTIPDIPYYLSAFNTVPRWIKPSVARLLFNSYMSIVLFCPSEVARTNRVTPSTQSDHFGVPQVDIYYETSDATSKRMESMLQFGRHVLRKASFGMPVMSSRGKAGSGIHYAGTCRMSRSATEGVVDKDLRAHDHDNLYVCDGSVLPTLPDKHSALTIMALADRLAAHLIGITR